MKKEKILVIGANGTVGRELVKILKLKGYFVRSTTSKSVVNSDELVQVDLSTGEGVNAAFEGVNRAFLISPPGYADQFAILSPLIQEAKRRGLNKVVLMTAFGANANESAPFRRAEIELEKSGLNYNIIRPNWFFQNFNTFWINSINEQKQILLPAGDAKVSFIDARDIAEVAAKLLISEGYDRQAFDLTGSEEVDHNQVSKVISEIVGKKIEYKEVSPESFKQGLMGVGIPEDYIDFLVLIFSFLKAGYNAAKTTSVVDITGQKPRTLLDYASDYKNSWLGSKA